MSFCAKNSRWGAVALALGREKEPWHSGRKLKGDRGIAVVKAWRSGRKGRGIAVAKPWWGVA